MEPKGLSCESGLLTEYMTFQDAFGHRLQVATQTLSEIERGAELTSEGTIDGSHPHRSNTHRSRAHASDIFASACGHPKPIPLPTLVSRNRLRTPPPQCLPIGTAAAQKRASLLERMARGIPLERRRSTSGRSSAPNAYEVLHLHVMNVCKNVRLNRMPSVLEYMLWLLLLLSVWIGPTQQRKTTMHHPPWACARPSRRSRKCLGAGNAREALRASSTTSTKGRRGST